jgi:hypothetical protein
LDLSENLTQWTPLQTFTATSNTITFVDPAALGAARRFYRARLAAP